MSQIKRTFWKKVIAVILLAVMISSDVFPVYRVFAGEEDQAVTADVQGDGASLSDHLSEGEAGDCSDPAGEDVLSDTAHDSETEGTQDFSESEKDESDDLIQSEEKETGDEAPLLGAEPNATANSLIIQVVDINGNPVPEEVLGDGLDIVYYEFPAAEFSYNPTGPTAFEPPRPIYMPDGHIRSKLDDYMKTIRITDPITDGLVISMEEAATPDNPYVIRFGKVSVGGAPDFGEEWRYMGMLYYDGSHADLITNSGTQTLSYSDGVFTLSVIHDDTIVHPTFKAVFDTSEYYALKEADEPGVYPFDVRFYGNEIRTLTITRDGTYVFDPKASVSLYFWNSMKQQGGDNFESFRDYLLGYVVLGSAYVDPDAYTKVLINGEEIPASVQGRMPFVLEDIGEDGTLYVSVNGGEPSPLEVTFVKEYIRQGVSVMLRDPCDAAKEEEFPLYLRVTATDHNNYSWRSVKTVKVEYGDLNKEIIVPFSPMNSRVLGYTGDMYDLQFVFEVFKDEQCTEAATEWGYRGRSVQTLYNYGISSGDYIWSWIQGEAEEMIKAPVEIRNRYFSLDIPVNIYTNTPSQMYPAWLKVELAGTTNVLKIDENGTTSIRLDRLDIYALTEDDQGDTPDLYLKWTVYQDEECTQVHTGWDTENKELSVRWDQSEETLYTNDWDPVCIDLVKTTSDRISVSMTADLGDKQEEFLPRYAHAVLSVQDGSFAPITVTKKLDSAEDVNTEFVFERGDGAKFGSDTRYTLKVCISNYEDPEAGADSGHWQAYENTGTLHEDGKLYNGVAELRVDYVAPKVEVDPEPMDTVISEDNKLWLKTILMETPKNYGESPVYLTEDNRQISSDGPVTVGFDYMVWVGSSVTAKAIVSEESRERVYDVNTEKVENASGAAWIAAKTAGTIKKDGTFFEKNGAAVLKPYEDHRKEVSVRIPVHVNNPTGEYPYKFKTVEGYSQESIAVRLYTLDEPRSDNSDGVRTFVSSGNGRRDTTYASYCFIDVKDLDDSLRGTVTISLDGFGAGKYYMDYWIGLHAYDYVQAFNMYGKNRDDDISWTHELGVQVTVTDDGQILYEDGTPVSLEFYYLVKNVMPSIDIHAEYPDFYDPELYMYESYESTAENKCPQVLVYRINGMGFTDNGGSSRIYLRNTLGSSRDYPTVAHIPEGNSKISSPHNYAEYLKCLAEGGEYDGVPVVGAIYAYTLANWYDADNQYYGSLYVRDYADDQVVFYPVGDYTLEYYVATNVANRVQFDDKWEHHWNFNWNDDGEAIKVHLAEDGRFYEILDDGTVSSEPYYINIRYLGEESETIQPHDSLKIKVETTVIDGADPEKVFTEGDLLVVTVTEVIPDQNYKRTIRYLEGTAEITEPGITEVELKTKDGSPVRLRKDGKYLLTYRTVSRDENGNYQDANGTYTKVNPLWPQYDNRLRTDSYFYHGDHYPYPDYFDYRYVDEEGYIRGYVYYQGSNNNYYCDDLNNPLEGDVLTFHNRSLVVPWKETDPSSVDQDDSGITYKPLTDLSQIKEKGNYIIVVNNRYDNKWYALAYDEQGGYQIELSDVHSFSDLENGYKVGTGEDFRKFVFQASKVSVGSDSTSLQLKTAIKDENKKTISLKMGSSAKQLDPLMTNSAGTLIVRSSGDDKFNISKGNYADLWYVYELFGWNGFLAVGSSRIAPIARRNSQYGDLMIMPVLPDRGDPEDSIYGGNETIFDYQSDHYFRVISAYAGLNVPGDINRYHADVDEKYLNSAYYNKLMSSYNSYNGGTKDFYILSDDVEEITQEDIKKYTLVRTMGDFQETFIDGSASGFVAVYTDKDGREYVLEPAKVAQVATKTGASGYRTLSTVVDHELTPNNNSGTSSNFGFEILEANNNGEYVVVSKYAFRKSRQNNAVDKQYLTLNGSGEDSAWTAQDDAMHGEGLVYVLHPTKPIISQADLSTPVSYKLSVIRNGETEWLGIAEDENGEKHMTTVTSEADAVTFDIYSDVLTRYYPSAYGTDLYKYVKVHNVSEINANDEIVVVYNDNGQRRIFSYPFEVAWTHGFASVYVEDEYSTFDTRTDRADQDTKFHYRIETDEYIKKPFAYLDPDEDEVLWAQGAAAMVIGPAKSEKPNQRKYEYVTPLGDRGKKVYLKADEPTEIFRYKSAETNFFPGDQEGEFYIRGGKDTAWLGNGSYSRWMLDLTTGLINRTGECPSFSTVGKEDRIAVEIYRRPASDETFTVEYYTTENELERSEKKPKDSFSLTQKMDLQKDGTDYVFVGWTTEYDKSGFLSLEDSANIFDYDDLSKVASVRREVKERFSLLGDCDPEGDNLIGYDEVEPKVVKDVLKVYPVYAVRGYSSAVTADDPDRMIVGASDFKDLQNLGDGTTDVKERWLGSINIEVYKDGELWVPGGNGGSTTGRRRNAPAKPVTATLYFAYHNDDAADLNIKFIADSVTQETLYAYMSSDTFDQAEPSEHYAIDAVYAEQGGSEDGLRYKYNWMDAVVGGQLDNVKGGSTVKIYVTTKYQVKYYLDDGSGNGYEELVAPKTDLKTWTDPNFYTTPGTENAVREIEESSDYVVTSDPEDSAEIRLINQTPDDGARFKDEKITRGEYSVFLYKFETYPHTIPVAELPSGELIPERKVLADTQWTIRDKDLKELAKQDPSSSLNVTETTYGTGNSVWSYKGEALRDITNTYHLYIKLRDNVDYLDLSGEKTWEDGEDQDKKRPEKIVIHLLADGEEVESKVVTEKENWAWTFKGKPNINVATGEEIAYTVKEDPVNGYITEVDGLNVTNTVTVTKSGEKTWDDRDDMDGIRPESIVVNLMADDTMVESRTVTEKDEWRWTFEDLPKYKDGKEIVYTAEEESVEGYEAKTDGMNITNTHEPKLRSIDIVKVVDVYESRSPVCCVFLVEGRIGNKMVYSEVVPFNITGTGSNKVTVGGIPARAEITVTEVYAGASYKVNGRTTQTIEPLDEEKQEEATVSVMFTDTHDGKTHSGAGADNKYTKQDDGSWTWTN